MNNMKINEIITNPPRDEYLDAKIYPFQSPSCQAVSSIDGLVLKRVLDGDDLYYGLFDKQNQLVGYFHLIQYKDMWQVSLVQLAQIYKGKGLGTFFYDYAVMNDKLKVLSDETNTGGPHGSVNLWNRLYNLKRYKVVGYDVDTDTILPDVTPNDVHNEKTNMRWLALPSTVTINEAISLIQKNMKERYVVWYGAGTTTETYFNY